MKVLVVGAGMAGAACAYTLTQAGCSVSVMEKNKHVGGRMASTQMAWSNFDLGAQYFTARDPVFIRQVTRWLKDSVVAAWDIQPHLIDKLGIHPSPDNTKRYFGTPLAQSPIESLLADCNVHLQQNIESLHKRSQGWFAQLSQHNQSGPYDYVVLAIPAPDVVSLLPQNIDLKVFPKFDAYATQVVVLSLQKAIRTEVEWSFVKDRAIDWLGQVNAKYNRNSQQQAWLMHFTPEATDMYRYNDDACFIRLAQLQLEQIFSQREPCQVVDSFSYLYPNARIKLLGYKEQYWLDAQQNLAACGDGFCGGRVEGAFVSGLALARKLLSVH
ncbi:NAD(P)/FAD-dependent oxidoreductase [Catenovulum sediminis]|uniref:FAD-dependent oxidoreductase n=1 Tax=Catenovulum sediminis TaxID=1740262 RepID=A0ABV1RH72_9ALTE|nr:FAD-dependent oxidoreductase [Catenovulum sediminis]